MITLKQVTKSFGEAQIIDRVSLEAMQNTSTVILGPSGTGKTTLLRLIAGLEMPDSGEIYLDGVLSSKPAWVLAPYRRGIGFVFQTSALWPHMTVEQNIMFGLHNLPESEAQHRLKELLEYVSLNGLERRYPHQISGGEARRVALIRTLAPRPKIILMDEPLTNVDPELKARLLSFIKQAVAETKACLIYVTHDATEASLISDRVLILRGGRFETE
jgi:iron(III) transport system ATP-binding protein